MDVLDFGGDFVNADGVNAEALTGGEGLAGELEENALENGC